MRGIIIAAGQGMRMRPYTDQQPKCMLAIHGRPLLAYTLEALRAAGCSDLTVIVGHLAAQVKAPGCRLIHNLDYAHNNILHSLMYARDLLDDDVMVTYADIFVEPEVHKRLAATSGDIVVVVDTDWQPYYEGRTAHPVSEAEKAFVEGSTRQVQVMGKHLDSRTAGSYMCGEFLGLWKMSATGARRFRDHFEALQARLSPLTPFRDAREWRKAYVTDFLTDLIACGTSVHGLLIERGWAELDTVQDYERLPGLIHRQRLLSLDGR